MIKADYQDSITNLACSIRKYFEVDYKHNTIKEVDEVLDKDSIIKGNKLCNV